MSGLLAAPKRPLSVVLAMVVIVAGAHEARAEQSADKALERPTGRVRSQDERLARLLADGYRTSPTFRRLVDLLERSDLLVYVRYRGPRAVGQDVGGHIQVVGRSSATRVVFIFVARNLSPVRARALVAHELQHAVEIASAPHVVDEASMRRHYQRVGTPHWAQPRRYETALAREVETLVLREANTPPPAPVAFTALDRLLVTRATDLVRRRLGHHGRGLVAGFTGGVGRLVTTVVRSLIAAPDPLGASPGWPPVPHELCRSIVQLPCLHRF